MHGTKQYYSLPACVVNEFLASVIDMCEGYGVKAALETIESRDHCLSLDTAIFSKSKIQPRPFLTGASCGLGIIMPTLAQI